MTLTDEFLRGYEFFEGNTIQSIIDLVPISFVEYIDGI